LLTKIDVDSENAFYIPILGATPKDSLFIQQITGLNPPDVTLFMGEYARDGGNYTGRRVGNRNVVITFDLNPNPALGETVKGLRQMLYKAFLDPLVDADYIKLRLHDEDNHVYYVVGYTEKIEASIFAQDTSTQVSIICPDPYIRDDVKTVKSDPSGWTTVPFNYTGTAETGFEVEIYITAPTDVLTLENNGRTMIMNRAFFAGDVVNINTNPGSRSMTVSHGIDLPKSLVASMSPLSPWLQLHSQSNVMKVYGNETTDLVGAVRSLAYTQSYWGI
jgi:hypothetical protein